MGVTGLDQVSAPADVATVLASLAASYATLQYVNTNLAPVSVAAAQTAAQNDPLGLGFVATSVILAAQSAQTWNAANDGRFARVISGGTISKVAFHCEVSSGNICVSVYQKSGTGAAAQPGTRLATSGAVSSPGTGYREVSLGASVTVSPGDYLALSCDNTTASFLGQSGNTRTIYAPFTYGQATAHPLPSSASAFATTSKVPLLIGVA